MKRVEWLKMGVEAVHTVQKFYTMVIELTAILRLLKKWGGGGHEDRHQEMKGTREESE
jgi:hypothetical protein